MPADLNDQRAIVFIDGQNLFHAVKEAFGYTYPNYDIRALAEAICRQEGWRCNGVRFYTGIPDQTANEVWHHFWVHKLAMLGRQGVTVFSRPLRYRNELLKNDDGTAQSILVGEEKGIDVRLAIDVIRLAHRGAYEVAIIFSQDQDLSEVADEIRVINREQQRQITVASAFPVSPTTRNRRGINNTEWLSIDREFYDRCIDKRDYRQERKEDN